MHWARVGDKQAEGPGTVALCPALPKGREEEGGKKTTVSTQVSARAASAAASVEILQLMPRTGASPCPSRRLQAAQSRWDEKRRQRSERGDVIM